jgi:hypothetical protein
VGGITGGGARLPVTDSHGGRRRTGFGSRTFDVFIQKSDVQSCISRKL